MHKNALTIIILIFFPFISLAESSADVKKIPLEISDAWARKSMSSNNNSAAYMKINNTTDEQITIIAASATDVANNAELHKSFVDEKGISRMVSVDAIVVPPKSTIELKQCGIHIMLLDLKETLIPGKKFPITIKMKGHDPITVESSVK